MADMAGKKPRNQKRGPVDSTLTIRCYREDREAWREAAQREGQTLTEWIITRLNRATKKSRESHQ